MQNSSQLELFLHSQDPSDLKIRTPNNSFLSSIWNYEKTILIIIGLVITGVISFSLGVERGKKISLLSNNARFDTALTTAGAMGRITTKPATQEYAPKNIINQKEKNSQAVFKKEPSIEEILPIQEKGYTIQLASYKTKTYAQKEADVLRKMGFQPLVLSKGSFIILCVGAFPNRGQAESSLLEIKKQKRYQGCIIRRL